jgi:uncharacterized repeat protein (TIGR03803 family)
MELAFSMVLLLLSAQNVAAQLPAYSILHTFDGTDGVYPNALIADPAGNLYGTLQMGGNVGCEQSAGCGTVYKLDPLGNETILYHFKGGTDGAWPYAGLTRDAAGNLYGTTEFGGGLGLGICDLDGLGCGVVFKLDPLGNETVLYRFGAGPEGGQPYSRLIRDFSGNLYGTTFIGGLNPCTGLPDHGCGVVFKIDANGNESILHTFTGGADGAFPTGLIQDKDGSFYGMTYEGGSSSCSYAGCGVIFKLDKFGNYTVLYTFTGGSDGGYPSGELVRDAMGNLYGTTYNGGLLQYNRGHGFGVVFKLDTNGDETILHGFTGQEDGATPVAGLILDERGNLYGTASYGVTTVYGNVFKISATGRFTVLHTFNGDDGWSPQTKLLRHSRALYGTTFIGGNGGNGYGVAFKISPQ